MKENFILISFDVEEFDIPLEYGQQVSEDEQMQTGYDGLEVLMNIVQRFSMEATFFTTANFAQRYAQAIKAISQQHEIASHTFYHSRFNTEDLAKSKTVLEDITHQQINGLRMPRMIPVDMHDVKRAGYIYDSSINPAYLPGRYNNRHLPRNPYREKDMLRFPASVTPHLRIPLFWLTFKNFPYNIYLKWMKNTLRKDGYVCLYFHPWEFTDLSKYRVPAYLKRDAGKPLQEKLSRLLADAQNLGKMISMERYIKQCIE